VSFLGAVDSSRVAAVSRTFREAATTNDHWQQLYTQDVLAVHKPLLASLVTDIHQTQLPSTHSDMMPVPSNSAHPRDLLRSHSSSWSDDSAGGAAAPARPTSTPGSTNEERQVGVHVPVAASGLPPKTFYRMYSEVASRKVSQRAAAGMVATDSRAIHEAIRCSIVGRCMCDVFQYLIALGLPFALCFLTLLLLGLRLDEHLAEWQVSGVGDISWILVFIPAAVAFAIFSVSWCSMSCMTHHSIAVPVQQPYPRRRNRLHFCRRCCMGCDYWKDQPMADAIVDGDISELVRDHALCSLPFKLCLGGIPCIAVLGLLLIGAKAAATYAASDTSSGPLADVSWMVIMVPSSVFLCCFLGLVLVVLGRDDGKELVAGMLCCCVLPVISTLMSIGHFLDEDESEGDNSDPFDANLALIPIYIVLGVAFLGAVGACFMCLKDKDDLDDLCDDSEECMGGLGACGLLAVLVLQVVLIAEMLSQDGPQLADSYTEALAPALFVSAGLLATACVSSAVVFKQRGSTANPMLSYSPRGRQGPVQGCCGICAGYGHPRRTGIGELFQHELDAAAEESCTVPVQEAYGEARVPLSCYGAVDDGMAQLLAVGTDMGYRGTHALHTASAPFLQKVGVPASDLQKWQEARLSAQSQIRPPVPPAESDEVLLDAPGNHSPVDVPQARSLRLEQQVSVRGMFE